MLGNVAQPRDVGQQLRFQFALRQLRQPCLHHRDRHAQFMRGIGQELVACSVALLHLVDGIVEGPHQRRDLGGHQLFVEARAGLADVQFLGLLRQPAHTAHCTMDDRRHHQQGDHDQWQEEPEADQPQHHQRAIHQPALGCATGHHGDAAAVLVAHHHPRDIQIGRHQRSDFSGTQCRQSRQQRRVQRRHLAALQPEATVIDGHEPQVATGALVQRLPARLVQHQVRALAVHRLGHVLGGEHVHAPGFLVTPGKDQRHHGEQHGECLCQEQAPRQAKGDRTDLPGHLRSPPAGSRRHG